jgi:hypothetical protein
MINETNATVDTFEWLPGLQLAACICYTIILLIGITGNTLVITIVMRYRDMRNATNLLLANLSVADLAFLLFCTPEGYQHLYTKDKYVLGQFMCKPMTLKRSTMDHRPSMFQVVSVLSYKMPRRLVQS